MKEKNNDFASCNKHWGFSLWIEQRRKKFPSAKDDRKKKSLDVLFILYNIIRFFSFENQRHTERSKWEIEMSTSNPHAHRVCDIRCSFDFCLRSRVCVCFHLVPIDVEQQCVESWENVGWIALSKTTLRKKRKDSTRFLFLYISFFLLSLSRFATSWLAYARTLENFMRT